LRYIINNDNLFFAALQDFQNTFADSTATGLDFKNHVATYCNIDLDAFFEQWYFGEGYPTYQVKYNQVGTDLYIEIGHTSSMPTVTPTFTNPISLRLLRQGQADTIIRFSISNNTELFTLPNFGTLVGTIGIDPGNWVINGNGGVSIDPTLAITEISSAPQKDFVLFPNPSSDVIQIANQKEVYSYDLYAANGQHLMNGIIAPGEKISLSHLKKGSYIIQFKGGNAFKCTKLVTIN